MERRCEGAQTQEPARRGAWAPWWSLRSEAKKRASEQNGRKSGPVKSRKKTLAARPRRSTATTRTPQERVSEAIALIHARRGISECRLRLVERSTRSNNA